MLLKGFLQSFRHKHSQNFCSSCAVHRKSYHIHSNHGLPHVPLLVRVFLTRLDKASIPQEVGSLCHPHRTFTSLALSNNMCISQINQLLHCSNASCHKGSKVTLHSLVANSGQEDMRGFQAGIAIMPCESSPDLNLSSSSAGKASTPMPLFTLLPLLMHHNATITVAKSITALPHYQLMAAVSLSGVAVQIVMSANKESVMSEKAMRAGFGQTIVVGYSEPVHSSQFPTFDDFANKVQREWDHQWQRVYSSQPEGKLRHTNYAVLYMCASWHRILPSLASSEAWPSRVASTSNKITSAMSSRKSTLYFSGWCCMLCKVFSQAAIMDPVTGSLLVVQSA